MADWTKEEVVALGHAVGLDAPASAKAILSDPLRNKGTAFTEEERDRLGLHGLLPNHVSTMDGQIKRRIAVLRAFSTPFEKSSGGFKSPSASMVSRRWSSPTGPSACPSRTTSMPS